MQQFDTEILRDDTYDVDVLGDAEQQITYQTPFENHRISGQRIHSKPFQEDKYPEDGTNFYRKRSYMSDDLSTYKDDNFYHRPFPGEIYEQPHKTVLESFDKVGSFFIGSGVGIIIAIIIIVLIFMFIRMGFLNKLSNKITDFTTGESKWKKERESILASREEKNDENDFEKKFEKIEKEE